MVVAQALPTLRAAGRVAAAVLLLATVVALAGPAALLAAVHAADAAWLLAGLLWALWFNVLSALRWRHLVGWLGHAMPAGWALAVSFRALAVGTLLPGATLGGDVLRAWHLHRDGCPRGLAAVSVLLDRLGAWWMLWALALAVGGSAGMTPVLQGLGLPPQGPLVRAVLLTMPAWPLLVLAGWRGLQGPGAAWLRQPRPLQAYAWQALTALLAQAASIAALACAARAFGITLPLGLIALSAAPIFLLASLPVGFGGWGTRELATVAAWSAFGVAAPQATSASLAFGVYGLVLAGLGLLPVPAGHAGRVPTSTG